MKKIFFRQKFGIKMILCTKHKISIGMKFTTLLKVFIAHNLNKINPPKTSSQISHSS